MNDFVFLQGSEGGFQFSEVGSDLLLVDRSIFDENFFKRLSLWFFQNEVIIFLGDDKFDGSENVFVFEQVHGVELKVKRVHENIV